MVGPEAARDGDTAWPYGTKRKERAVSPSVAIGPITAAIITRRARAVVATRARQALNASICLTSARRHDSASAPCDDGGRDGPDRDTRADRTLLPLRAVRPGGVAIPGGLRARQALTTERASGARQDARACSLLFSIAAVWCVPFCLGCSVP
eukprot:scaffold34754_cov56-Phaeocystis_antarctica.AAC.1